VASASLEAGSEALDQDAVERDLKNLQREEEALLRLLFGIGVQRRGVDELSRRLGCSPCRLQRRCTRALRSLRRLAT